MTDDGTHCEPLTLSDAHSRYLLRCQALGRNDSEHVWPVLDAAFREFGLPLRLRSDNGPPFASTGAGGLSRLAVKVIKAGVQPERIAPGKPQQNGRLERLHLTLLRDTASPSARSLREQLGRFRDFSASIMSSGRMPHSATTLRLRITACRRGAGTVCCANPNTRPRRRVHRNGAIRWRGAEIYLSEALAGEPVGLVEQHDGGWTVHYGPIELGIIDHRGDRLRRPRKARGFVDTLAGYPQPHRPHNHSNKYEQTGKLLPMSSVRSVTYVAGCSRSWANCRNTGILGGPRIPCDDFERGFVLNSFRESLWRRSHG